MKLFGILSLMAGCAASSSNLDLESDTKGPFDPTKNFAIVLHEEEIGGGYDLVSATYQLDGEQIFRRANSEGWSDLPEDVRVYRGYAAPGPHRLLVILEYQADDHGIFTYANGYKLKIKSGTKFEARSNEVTAIHAVLTPDGKLKTQADQRPEVRYYVTRPSEPQPIAGL